MEIPWDIIAKEQAAETSVEEKAVLEKWLQDNPGNQKEYDSVIEAWVAVDKSKTFQPNETNAWEKVAKKTQGKPLQKTKRVTWRMAAAVLAIVTIGGLLYVFTNRQSITYATLDTAKVILLEDGSTVTLASHSKLEVFEFSEDKREMNLSGKASFEVTKNKGVFKVYFDESVVKVLGTSFIIDAKKNEYFVEVYEGKVACQSGGKSNEIVLLKNQKAAWDNLFDGFKKDSIIRIKKSNQWLYEMKTYRNEQISVVFDDLAALSNYKFEFGQSKNAKCRFTGTLDLLDIEGAMETLKYSNQLEFGRSLNDIVVSGPSCE